MEALLIIDMQVGVFRLSKRYDEIGIVKRINQVSNSFRKNKKPVIFVQHDGTKENYLHTGTEEEIHVNLQPLVFREPSRKELIDLFRERISDPDYIAFLAFDVDKPVGYVVFHILRKPENVFAYAQNILEIDHIHITERYRRQGICRKLFAKALEVARAFDIKDIQLGVWSRNDRAVAAFNALGFRQKFHIMALEDKAKLKPFNAVVSQGGTHRPT